MNETPERIFAACIAAMEIDSDVPPQTFKYTPALASDGRTAIRQLMMDGFFNKGSVNQQLNSFKSDVWQLFGDADEAKLFFSTTERATDAYIVLSSVLNTIFNS